VEAVRECELVRDADGVARREERFGCQAMQPWRLAQVIAVEEEEEEEEEEEVVVVERSVVKEAR